MSVDFHGNVVAKCTPSKSWSLNEHVKTLRGEEHGLSWRVIYWKMWGITRTLFCGSKLEYFACSELKHCDIHPECVTCEPGQNKGTHPCCGDVGYRFWPWVDAMGCQADQHCAIASSDEDRETMAKLLRRHSLVAEPYDPKARTPFTTQAKETTPSVVSATQDSKDKDSRPSTSGAPFF